ncbi:2-octaprenyl-6-methoxyphenyl hydroxylase [Luteimonas chenhongjianii]|uniref:2-octaprenyl-6-methoxyphenyl hydroxylase n=1 Tax=Luteimonas chenhongjianii TaxID=2006110 RepID=A0A290XCY7_9GAMM|nr:2-octaprenyl-6-methoxyphenyl hydroxylase [Luteimonas chenhongjianii]ATD67024.1 2-octaprenyl-6-methoxyphenyl hydroxylase [Luteimonas chenhongjianii]
MPEDARISSISPRADAASDRHDVLIVGGGLVGASLAIALERAGVGAALVEATPPGAMPAVFDQRNLSFAEATVHALNALGVLQKLQAPAGPIREIHVSRAGDFGRVRLAASDYGREAFGQVVVARDFGEALEARLSELPALVRHRPARFIGFDGIEDGWRVVRLANADGEYRVRARLVVGADGSDSAIRDSLGIEAEVHDYAQTLFIARLRTARAPDGRAFERLTDDGPTALLPRGDRHYGLVHGVAAADAAAVAALDDAAFLARVQRIFGWRAGRLLGVGPRSQHSARRVVAARVVDTRAVLVGNAAQSLHPVGAQGFNLGLRDALTLAECIAGAGDPGAPALLEHYTARRREDRERTLAFSDGLARITANPAALLRPLRSLGLLAIDRDSSLQAMLAGGAMGYRGDVPALCRGGAA